MGRTVEADPHREPDRSSLPLPSPPSGCAVSDGGTSGPQSVEPAMPRPRSIPCPAVRF